MLELGGFLPVACACLSLYVNILLCQGAVEALVTATLYVGLRDRTIHGSKGHSHLTSVSSVGFDVGRNTDEVLITEQTNIGYVRSHLNPVVGDLTSWSPSGDILP